MGINKEYKTKRTGLEDEKPLELVRRDEQDRELDAPEDQVADHALGRDTDALGDVVRDVQVGRPDGTDDLRHGRRARVGLDGMPEEGCDSSGDDGEAGEVPAEGGAHGHGEGDMETSTDHAVEDQGNGADQTAKDDADDSLAPGLDPRLVSCVLLPMEHPGDIPGEAEGDDGGRSHPALGIEGVGEPVSEDGPRRPCSSFHGGHIAVDVGPEYSICQSARHCSHDRVGAGGVHAPGAFNGKRRGLLGQDPA